MPSHVEDQGLNRKRIRQIVQLLQDQNPDHHMQIFLRPPETVIEVVAKFAVGSSTEP